MPSKEDAIARALRDTLISPNESDSNFEAAGIVDGLFAIARSINKLAEAVQDASNNILSVAAELANRP